ncbi:hypothetical protein ACFLZZ_03315 [Nanoarchaeota archaeon]
MIIELLHFLIGAAFLLFIPGFLLSLVLFKELDILERIALAMGLSISIDVLLGLILGFNKTMAQFTGGITELTVWIILILLSAIFGFIYYKKKS